MNTDTVYNTSISLTLTPVWHSDPPLVTVRIDDFLQQLALTNTQTFEYNIVGQAKDIVVSVELSNKKDSDTVLEKNLDKAVIIDKLTVNGILDSRFVWAGQYRPSYPEPWYSQQIEQPSEVLQNQNYLGWNGVWTVTVQVPAFLWIHQLLGLGWVYN